MQTTNQNRNMKNKNQNLWAMISLGLFLVAACAGPKSDRQEANQEGEFDKEGSETVEQDEKSQRPSPPATASGLIGELNITIQYSTPAVKDRVIWGALVPYNSVWRTGANEATVFEVDQDVLINGELLREGKYGLFTIPTEGDWTVIFNEVHDQWGAFNYDESQDILRIQVTPQKEEALQERLFFDIDDSGNVILKWEYVSLGFEVTPRR